MVDYHELLLQAKLLLQLQDCQEAASRNHLVGGLETYLLQRGHTLLEMNSVRSLFTSDTSDEFGYADDCLDNKFYGMKPPKTAKNLKGKLLISEVIGLP